MGPGSMAGARMARRNLLVAGCAVLALAGCTTAEQAPPWARQPSYSYAPPRVYAPPRAYLPPQAPLPSYGDPDPPPHAVAPRPAAPSPAPPSVAAGPAPARHIPPVLEPADPDCGWWRLCNLWAGT
jgi:hypothetical protein